MPDRIPEGKDKPAPLKATFTMLPPVPAPGHCIASVLGQVTEQVEEAGGEIVSFIPAGPVTMSQLVGSDGKQNVCMSYTALVRLPLKVNGTKIGINIDYSL